MEAEQRAKLSEKAKAYWTPERKAEASARAKARQASPPSPSGRSKPSRQSSAAPSPLPSAAERETMSESMFERLMEKISLTQEGRTEEAKAKKLLPDDPDERDKCLKLARLPARVPVNAVDQLAKLLELTPLSEDEREMGIDAWAALFWQLGLFRNGWVLVALWLFGVVLPRAAEWWVNLQREREGLPKVAQGNHVPKPAEVKTFVKPAETPA